MSTPTIVAIYFIIWWVVLFTVLPFGVRSQDESGEVAPGTDPGAPTRHRLARKFLWTTVVASVLFALFYGAYAAGLVPLDFITRHLEPAQQIKKEQGAEPCS